MGNCQAIGRGLRPADGKDVALIFDHSDNHNRLGFVTDIAFDVLDDGSRVKKETKRETEERLPKECPRCTMLRPPKLKACPGCGFEARPRSDVVCEDGELVELKRKGKADRVYSNEEKQHWWSMCLGIQRERNKKEGYASHIYRERMGVWPRGLADFPLPPNDEIKRFVTHRNMKRAFGKAKAGA